MAKGCFRALSLALLIAGVFLHSAPAKAADPFRSGSPAASAPSEAPGAATPGFIHAIAGMQRDINEAVSTRIRSLAETGSLGQLAGVLALAFLYGVLHAAGPGHGKAVVASYFLARRERWTKGVLLGSGISLIQGLAAIVMVGLLKIVLDMASMELTGRTTLVEAVSYGLICLIGFRLLWGAIRGEACAHDHGAEAHHHHEPATDRRSGLWMTVSAGLVPCSSAIILLLFALANDAFLIGVAAVAALSIGMAATVSAIGLATILARATMARLARGGGLGTAAIERGLGLAGASLLIVFSALLLFGAVERL